jgi:hypothetical protein
MSYSIKVSIFQTNPGKGAYFRIVEKTAYIDANGWDEVYDHQVLKMIGSGTSGSLRLQSDTGESFIVTLGVHNYKRWGDIVTNLTTKQTGCIINPEYYNSQYPDRVRQREKQLSAYSVSNLQGRKFSLEYTKAEGNDLEVRVVIG